MHLIGSHHRHIINTCTATSALLNWTNATLNEKDCYVIHGEYVDV